jgi:hypothetical protein
MGRTYLVADAHGGFSARGLSSVIHPKKKM